MIVAGSADVECMDVIFLDAAFYELLTRGMPEVEITLVFSFFTETFAEHAGCLLINFITARAYARSYGGADRSRNRFRRKFLHRACDDSLEEPFPARVDNADDWFSGSLCGHNDRNTIGEMKQ